jgi:hypothetical protein
MDWVSLSQKTAFLIVTAVKTSDLAILKFDLPLQSLRIRK